MPSDSLEADPTFRDWFFEIVETGHYLPLSRPSHVASTLKTVEVTFDLANSIYMSNKIQTKCLIEPPIEAFRDNYCRIKQENETGQSHPITGGQVRSH